MDDIAGFLLVDEPEPFASELPDYHGVERDAWWWFYENPPSAGTVEFDALERMRAYNRHDFHSVKLSPRLDDVRRLMRPGQEILVVGSRKLRAIKPIQELELHQELRVEFLGFEPIHSWSLLRGSVYACPERFSEWVTRLNERGLLSDRDAATQLQEEYLRAAREGFVEPLVISDELDAGPDAAYGFDVLELARVTARSY